MVAEIWAYGIVDRLVALKVVSHYDLSVLSMSEMGFQKQIWMGGRCMR